MNRTLVYLTWLCIAAWTTGAAAQTASTLIDDELHPAPVAVQSIRDEMISYFDPQRDYRRESIDRFLQWRTSHGLSDPSAERYGMVEMVDGQRLRGAWAGADESGEALWWRHPLLGETRIELDDLRAIRAAGQPVGGKTVASDTVALTNGDTLTGVVIAAEADGVMLDVGSDEEPMLIPLERIAHLQMANPPRARRADGHLVYLTDGSRVLVHTLHVEDGRLLLEGDVTQPIALSQVARIDFAAGRRRLIGLAELPMTVKSGGEVFGMPVPPRVVGANLHLHAPLELEFDLPAGAQRFGAVAELDADEQDPVWWADFDLVIQVDGREVARRHIDDRQRKTEINLPATGSVLTLRLELAANGPIMDRLRLRDPVVLIQTPQP